MPFNLTIDNYNRIINNVAALKYSTYKKCHNLDVHQTIKYLIYQLKIATGEIRTLPNNSFTIILRIFPYKPSNLPRKKNRSDFKDEFSDPNSFTNDKEILLEKMRKAIFQEQLYNFPPYVIFQGASRYDYLSYLFNLIDNNISMFISEPA